MVEASVEGWTTTKAQFQRDEGLKRFEED